MFVSNASRIHNTTLEDPSNELAERKPTVCVSHGHIRTSEQLDGLLSGRSRVDKRVFNTGL
jgi:hypothetical protein